MRRSVAVLAVAAGAAAAVWTGTTAEGHLRGAVHGADPGGPGRRAVTVAKAPEFDRLRLRGTLRAYLRNRPGRAGVLATDLRSGLTFGLNETSQFVTASVIKLDILAALLLQRQGQGLGLSGSERALAARMIRRSDNAAADALYADIGRDGGLRRAGAVFGFERTDPYPVSWGSSWTSPSDQVRLIRSLASGRGPLAPANRRYVLRLMRSVVPAQAWGISAAARPGERVALKNGWVPLRYEGNGWAVNSVGRITGPGHDFVVAVFSCDSPTMGDGVSTVEHVATTVVSALRGAEG
ncbi:serine hydrolase [Actinomadura opuntiae]|uniref:serine hydrolase n=1 Tax=Actinomadura sp. OS1-43 TaxID=604315 RepID=UPI00255B22B5|nr:serine hydrolase [Actinomadura sp. OS1-43]MDL4814817.1 serine hydrolase [Actinomadura sp. OS1-43]